MCRQAWCLRAVLEQTLGLLSCLAAGGLTEHVLFTKLAQGFGASAAGRVGFEPASGSATITIWSPLDDLGEPREVLDRLPQALPLFLQWLDTERRSMSRSVAASQSSWQGTVGAGQTRDGRWPDVADIAHVPLHHEGPTLRAVVLVRSESFNRRDLHVLDRLREPMSALTRLTEDLTPDPPVGSHISNADRLAGLTTREVDVLRLVAEGMLATSIAARLDVSPRTVHKHLGNVYRKLDAHDRLIAVRRAEAMGLLAGRHPTSSHGDEVVLTMKW